MRVHQARQQDSGQPGDGDVLGGRGSAVGDPSVLDIDHTVPDHRAGRVARQHDWRTESLTHHPILEPRFAGKPRLYRLSSTIGSKSSSNGSVIAKRSPSRAAADSTYRPRRNWLKTTKTVSFARLISTRRY